PGLEIAMNDPEPVRLSNACARLNDVRDGLADRKLGRATERGREIMTFEELHDDDGAAVLRVFEVHDASDEATPELSRCTRLAGHAGVPVGAAVDRRLQHLEGDFSLRGDVHRLEDNAHSALPELTNDSVFPEHDIADLGQPPHRRTVTWRRGSRRYLSV